MSNPRRTSIGIGVVSMLILLIIVRIYANDVFSDINRTFPILKEVYKEVAIRYVDDVDAEKLLKAGIDGMLGTLDPYSNYIEKEDKEQLQILTDGKYEGVGMGLSIRNGDVTVADPPFIGTPAERAGIREGDVIIRVDDEPTQGKSLDETVQRIRGPAGTAVVLTIRRNGMDTVLDFTLIREKIKIEDVRYAGIVDGDIGYIRLTRFSKNAAQEIREAIRDFQSERLGGVILDLRSNPGGMLEAAVHVSDVFLPKGATIVSTRGRSRGSIQEFSSRYDPLYGDGPLVVLVNGGSASASEIVAGAIQDHDRGLVIGDTTFGKGLVQTVVPLSDVAALKITTAKYYTPSGRCIQRQDYSMWSDTLANDGEELAYHTDKGRPVFGGGGIIPDIVIIPDRVNDLVWDLQRKSMYFNFAVEYTGAHTDLDSNVTVSNDMLQAFRKYLKKEGYTYKHPIESTLADLKKESIKEGYEASLLLDIEKLQKSLNQVKDDMFESSIKDITRVLRLEVASKAFGSRRESEIGLQDDKVVQRAITLVRDQALYASILEQ
ncbi:S41 family peptidase [bacterium]|nr:S41 family peptidase [bacterium]